MRAMNRSRNALESWSSDLTTAAVVGPGCWSIRRTSFPTRRHERLAKFRRRFGVPYPFFLDLVEGIKKENWKGVTTDTYQLGGRGTRKCIPVEIKVLAVLRMLGRGNYCDDIADFTGMSESTVQDVFHKFTERFAREYYPIWVRMPDEEELKRVIKDCDEVGMTGAMGSVDVTHVHWASAPHSERPSYTGKEGYPTIAYEYVVYPRLPRGEQRQDDREIRRVRVGDSGRTVQGRGVYPQGRGRERRGGKGAVADRGRRLPLLAAAPVPHQGSIQQSREGLQKAARKRSQGRRVLLRRRQRPVSDQQGGVPLQEAGAHRQHLVHVHHPAQHASVFRRYRASRGRLRLGGGRRRARRRHDQPPARTSSEQHGPPGGSRPTRRRLREPEAEAGDELRLPVGGGNCWVEKVVDAGSCAIPLPAVVRKA
ncbi:unnamed protein product [Pylaiella littoralis]